MRLRVRHALSAIALFAIYACPLWAESHARIVRLSYIDGDVQIDNRDGHGFEQAIQNMPITEGTKLWTRSGGKAEVEFEEGGTVRLVPDSRVEFTQLSLSDSGARRSAVELDEGTAYFNLHPKNKEELRIIAGKQEITIVDSARFRVQLSDRALVASVFKGSVDVQDQGKSVRVKKDENVTFDLTDPGRYGLARGVTSDAYDNWDRQRQDYREQYRSSATYNSDANYGYGMSDLNYYGSYAYVPSYGWLWRPNAYSISWSPFSNGNWVFSPGYGYTWVSTYPWGWTPYHYGSWVFVPGYGWCWSPGNSWNGWTNWNSAPVVVNPPRGFAPPQNPGSSVVITGHPRVVPQNPNSGFTGRNNDPEHRFEPGVGEDRRRGASSAAHQGAGNGSSSAGATTAPMPAHSGATVIHTAPSMSAPHTASGMSGSSRSSGPRPNTTRGRPQ